jgi:dihydrofolate reductase
MAISIVVTIDPNGVIALNGDLPWQYSKALEHFAPITRAMPVVLGFNAFRCTSNSIKRTHNLYSLSRRNTEGLVQLMDGLFTSNSLENVIEAEAKIGNTDLVVLGGYDLFELVLPFAVRIYFTKMHLPVEYTEKDTIIKFPQFSKREWECTELVRAKDCSHITYTRKVQK